MRTLLMTTVFIVSLALMFTMPGEAKTSIEISSIVEVSGWRYVVDVSEELVDTQEFKKEPPYTIGYVTIFMDNTWSVQMKEEIAHEVSKHEDLIEELIHLDASLETASQISAIEDLVARGVDAIVVDPISPVAMEGVFRMAQENGIPVIGISSPIPTEQVTAWVGRDDVEYGRVTAQWLVETIDFEGNIIALSGIAGNPVSEQRWEGAEEVFEAHPDINLLTREFADWGFSQGKSTMASLLAAYPDIDAVWSGGGAMTQGAMEAFVDAGRELVPMVGEANNGFLLDWIEYSEEGFSSIAFNNPTNHSAIGLRLALKALNGEPIPEVVNATAPYIFTLEDAKRYVRPDFADGYWVGTELPEEILSDLWAD